MTLTRRIHGANGPRLEDDGPAALNTRLKAAHGSASSVQVVCR